MFVDDLFAAASTPTDAVEPHGKATFLLPGFVRDQGYEFLKLIWEIEQQAAFRHMVTPSGFEMSVAMTNCGEYGWISGEHGYYHYGRNDPASENPWPAMPALFFETAVKAAEKAGFKNFKPDSCIINRYKPGAKLGLHQDSDEKDFTQPVVSVSLGLPAVFQLGGNLRNAPVSKLMLHHGDVVVWGGPDRMRYHGIEPVKDGVHPLAGSYRYNLSIRVAS